MVKRILGRTGSQVGVIGTMKRAAEVFEVRD
jgi:hypothetical protein